MGNGDGGGDTGVGVELQGLSNGVVVASPPTCACTVPTEEPATPRDTAVACYDWLVAEGRRPAGRNWVARAIGRLGHLDPDALVQALPSVQWAVQEGRHPSVAVCLSKADFEGLIDRWRADVGPESRNRGQPEPGRTRDTTPADEGEHPLLARLRQQGLGGVGHDGVGVAGG